MENFRNYKSMKHNFEDERRFNDQIMKEKDILEAKFIASEQLATR